jgi:ABC-type branched-subunit amino acid transport system ATPase component
VRIGQVQIGETLISLHDKENPIFGIDVLATSYDEARKLWAASKPTIARNFAAQGLMVLFAVPWPNEPSEGVAPVIVEEMADTIIELKKEGLSVLLSEQNIHFAEIVCDRVYVLEKGQIQWTGPMTDLAGDIDVQRRLLSV